MVFTSWAAAQVIIDEDMHHLSDEEQGQILGEVNRLVFLEVIKRNPDMKLLPDSPDLMDPQLPAHLISTYYPTLTKEPGDDLLGQTIRYRDSKNEIKECTVDDYGTSRLKGDWFYVTYNDDVGTEVTASEMKSMLASRVG